jgi:two-component system sensor histidine kinase PilS (NtrC family)
LSAVLFVGLVLTQYLYATGNLDLPIELELLRSIPSVDMARFTVGLNLFGFFAVAFVSGALAERAVQKEAELEHATEAIADLQAFNQFVVDNLVSGLATADAQNRLLTFNRSAMAITGNTEAPPIGRSAAEVLQLPEPFASTIGQELSSVRSRRTDYTFRHPDGRSIDVGLSVASLPMPDGSRGYLYTFQDVTDMKRFEHNARLQQRLAAVGEMAAGIAHEIRNPLASMSGSMQMLRQELPLSGDQAQLMDIVLRESERLNQTIKSFLAYARPQRLLVEPLDLRTVVRETATLLRNSTDVGDRHTIDVHQSEREVIIDADEGQIRQIVWNLATNGLKAMPDGGTLTISAQDESSGGERIGVLRVEDEGVGVPAEDLDSIFQPFRGSFGKSSGLGLAIVHRLVTDYGGRIDVRPRERRGTCFKVSFPVVRHVDAGRQAS